MRGNIPIPELTLGEEVWLMVVVTSVRERRTLQGKLFIEAHARNASGTLSLKGWSEAHEDWKGLKPGLWGITGKLETFQERPQFVLAEIDQSPSSNTASINKPIPCCLVLSLWISKRWRCLTFASGLDHNSSVRTGSGTCGWNSSSVIWTTSQPKRNVATSWAL
jgi:hypothetical protein